MVAASASATWSIVSFAALRRSGSTMTEISRSSLARTSTFATPGTRLSSGRTSNSARSRRSLAGTLPVRLIMKMGKIDGVIRSTCISVPAGSVAFASSAFPCMSCSA